MANRFTRLATGSLLLGATAFAAPSVLADDDEYGTYIYQGTCDDIASARVVEDIGELEHDDDDADEHWQILGMGDGTMPSDFHTDDDDLDDDDDLTIESMLDEPHMVVVHTDEDRDSDVVACGDITGQPDEDGILMLDLQEVDDSGYEGRAAFGSDLDDVEDDEDEDEIDTVIGIWPAGEVAPLGTPESTPIG